jgi:hypothetical protein
MISPIQGNASWLPASHASQVSSREMPGEMEHDGDSDDVAGAVKSTAAWSQPRHMGSRINTLA